jgi:hypothetical protein
MTSQVELLNAAVRLREREAEEAHRVPPPPTPAQIAARVEREAAHLVHTRAESVFNEYGRSAPLRNDGESILQYRLRIVNELKPNSSKAHLEISRGIDAASLAPIEREIYSDAAQNRWHPVDLKPGQMREVVKIDPLGREVHEFVSGAGSRGLFKQVYGEFIGPTQLGVICVAEPDGKGGQRFVPTPVPYLPA